MTTLRTAAQQALEALSEVDNCTYINDYGDAALDTAYESGMVYKAIAALRAALAEPVQEPVAWMCSSPELMAKGYKQFSSRCEGDWNIPVYLSPPQRQPQTIDEALQQPRAMAQAYENGYKAGVAAEREECAQVCEARFMGDMTREDMEARRCAAAIRARGEHP